MDNNVFLIILLATIMHAVWNGMVKKHPDKVVAVSAIVFGHVPASIIAIILLPAPSLDCIPYIIASALIHQGYNWYLLSSYKIGDLTKVYPIARGFGPLVATIISILILGLVLDNIIILSICLICLGIMILGIFDQTSKKNSKIIQYSLFTGFFIGLYSLVDGYGARVSLSAITYMSWSFILIAIFFPIVLKFKKQENIFKNVMDRGKQIFWVGGTLSYVIYMIVVWGFTKAPIPMVGALRESSIFFSIFIGYLFLKEKITLIKIFCIILILIGVVGLKLF
jgi:drug/metabolite transporter (DMT)-like permease